MEADTAEIGIEGLAYINALGDAYEARTNAICEKTKPSYQEYEKDSYGRYRKYNGRQVKEETEDRFKCLFFKNDPTPLQVKHYLSAGFALSDLYCKNFFRRVSSHSQKRGFSRNNVNDVGATMSVILGLAKAGSTVTGGAGALFGLADSVFRTYDQQFLISPDLANVQKLVFAAQMQLANKYQSAPPDDYYKASAMIADHANACSYVGMKVLINASLSKASDAVNADVTKASSETSIPDMAANYIVVRDRIQAAVKAQAEKEAAEKAAAAKAAEADVAAKKAAADKAAADKAEADKAAADKAAADKPAT